MKSESTTEINNPTHTKGKILWLSDSPTTCTGYATISSNIMNGMVDAGWDVDYMGHNYMGQMLKPPTTFEDGRELKFNLHGGGMAQYCQDLIQPRINAWKPDIFGILLDTFMLYPWLIDMPINTRSLFYYPSDGGGGLPRDCDRVLKKMNKAVCMSRFGQKQAKEVHGLDVDYIPHAVDTKNYFPLSKEDKEKLKAQWGLTGKFVIGSVYRNQGRKMPDLLLKAFAKFAEGKDDVVLLLHTDPNDAAAVFSTPAILGRLGIEHKVRFTGMNFFNGFTYKQMNDVYNAMDVFSLSTSGEGFGVPTIEAQACGVPVVVPDNTTGPELVMEDGQSGLLAKNASEIVGSWDVVRYIVDVDDLAKQLQYMYDNPLQREVFGATGVRKIHEHYNWDKVNKQWDKLFEEMIK